MDIINIIIRTNALLCNPGILFNPRINKMEFILTPYLKSKKSIILHEKNTLKIQLNAKIKQIEIVENINVEDSKEQIQNLKDEIQIRTANLTVCCFYNILNKYFFEYFIIPFRRYIRENLTEKHEILETEDTNPRDWIDNLKYHFYKIVRSIGISNRQINMIESINRGELEYGRWDFPNDSLIAYKKLLKYRNEVAIPIFIGILSLITRSSPFLYEWYKFFRDILCLFLLSYVAWYSFCKYKDIKTMLILVDKIMILNKESKATKDRAFYWIFGNYRILWECNFSDHESILERHKQEMNSKAHYDSLGPFQGFLFDFFRSYYGAY